MQIIFTLNHVGADDTRRWPSTEALTTERVLIITFRVRRSRGEMYIGHGRLCVCLSLAAFPHYCTDPNVTWANGRGAFYLCTIEWICNRCTGFVAMTTWRRTNAKRQRVLVLTRVPG